MSALTWATTYYIGVRTVNNANLTGSALYSNGQRLIDVTSPTAPGTVNDGNGADTNVTYSSYSLSANWTSSADADSGISSYSYAISSTTAGGTAFVGWTTVGASTWVTRSGLTLTGGSTYYFTVRAYNFQGLVSTYTANSNGQYVSGDTTGPGAPSAVRDGTGTDVTGVYSTTTLSGNWDAAIDAESGISAYLYAIGTSTSATNIVSWTNIGNVLTITNSSLSLPENVTYYVLVKAMNGFGMTGSPRSSNGAVLLTDGTDPGAPGAVRDGTGLDISTTTTLTSLSANWDVAVDAESGIARYLYAIGTTAGGTNVAAWADSTSTSVTASVTLVIGTTYYFSVKAENGAGLQGTAANSNGVRAYDATAPGASSAVRDGTGADISVTTTTAQISANWNAAADAESGISKYYYAISSTTAGLTDFVAWTDNFTSTSVTLTTTLRVGTTYYFTVKAVNGSGVHGLAANSNGLYITALAAPVISNVTVTGITKTEATINWTTDNSATSQVEYGITTIYDTFTRADAVLMINHSVVIDQLNPGTIYHFRVKSTDANGIEGVSGDYTFTTVSAPNGAPAVKAYPNPYTYSEATPLKFYVNGDNSSIEIYTISGALLKKLPATTPGSNTINWDGKNESGNVVKSGVYLYIAKDTAGTRKGKFIFIR